MDGMEVQENQAQREREVERRRTIATRGRRETERKKDKVYTYREEDWLEPRTGCINARTQKKRWRW